MTSFYEFLYNEFINSNDMEVRDMICKIINYATENLDFVYDHQEALAIQLTGMVNEMHGITVVTNRFADFEK